MSSSRRSAIIRALSELSRNGWADANPTDYKTLERELDKRPRMPRRPHRRNELAQAAYDAEWGTDNGFSPWDNMPSAGEY